MNVAEIERQKYTEIWRDVPEYRDFSPGLENVQRFYDVIKPIQERKHTLIDIGCGTGVAGLEFKKRGMTVDWVDITDAGLLPEVDMNRFVQDALWGPWADLFRYKVDYGFCCDVMEHIPPEYTMLVIDRILSCCRTTWFQIALLPDNFGESIGKPLHLTVRSFAWWRDHLASLGKVVEARDLCGCAVYVVERKVNY